MLGPRLQDRDLGAVLAGDGADGRLGDPGPVQDHDAPPAQRGGRQHGQDGPDGGDVRHDGYLFPDDGTGPWAGVSRARRRSMT